jgi:hypothetical protein
VKRFLLYVGTVLLGASAFALTNQSAASALPAPPAGVGAQ